MLRRLKELIEAKKGDTAATVQRFLERVEFKLRVANDCLDELLKLEQAAGTLVWGAPENRYLVEKWMDILLYELTGALDPFLQAINAFFGLGLQPRKVTLDAVCKRLPNDDALRKTLANLSKEPWFKALKEYRNHSAHRSIIGFYITLNLSEREPTPRVYLYRDPLRKEGPADETVTDFCRSSIQRVGELIEKLSELTVRSAP